jgi:type VI secretion system protein ImpJ
MSEAQLLDRIEWHEGMLLSPQHFQQESARVDALVGWQGLAVDPTAWGVRGLVVDDTLLPQNRLRITKLEAILPNGVALRYDAASAQGHVLELDLTPHAELMTRQELSVYLVLGAARSLNVTGQASMFRSIHGALTADEVSDALPCEVPRMAANVALMAGKAPGPSFVHLRLMTLHKEGESVRRGAFWPAQLEVPPASDISVRVHELVKQMRTKALFLGRQAALSSSSDEDRLTTLEQRARLSNLTLNLPWLEAVLYGPAMRPHALYLALCAQIGPLSSLRPGTVPPAPPPYVHADSHGAFDTVLGTLQALVAEVSEDWKACVFTLDDGAFVLPLRPEWVSAQLVVGLRGQGEREMTRWMDGALIASRTVSLQLGDRRVLGAERRRIDGEPRLRLRGGEGSTLFAIDVGTDYIVAGQDLLISNVNEQLQSERPHEIVLYIKG